MIEFVRTPRGPHRRGRSSRTWPVLALTALAALVVACDADTLYDSDDPGPQPGAPDARILEPTDGGHVQAGRDLPIRTRITDPEGVTDATLRIRGAVEATVVREYSPPAEVVTIDTVITVPEDAEGTIEIELTASNTNARVGEAGPIFVTVSDTDLGAPGLGVTVEAAERMELTDEIEVTLSARDNPGGSGIRSVGMTAIVVNVDRGDSTVIEQVETFDPAVADSVMHTFTLSPTFVDSLDLPDTLDFEVHGFVVDDGGMCTAAVDQDRSRELSCGTLTFEGESYVVANRIGNRSRVLAVAGRTSAFQLGGTIADLVVDNARDRVYLSNLSRNRLNVLTASSGEWEDDVVVGSEPWGMAMNRGGDSLFVANSGGTSISAVSLDGAPSEDLSERYHTRNAPLFEITLDERDAEEEGEGEDTLYSGIFIDYSDRPQFLAQDDAGRLLYSTRPTPSATDGTVRVARRQAGWQEPNARILLTTEDVAFEEDVFAIAHVDSVKLFHVDGDGDRVEIYDHTPGFPNDNLQSGVQRDIREAIAAIAAAGSDIAWGEGRWIRNDIALADTTYLAVSGDRKYIAVGEGGTTDRAGRIIMWSSDEAALNYEVQIADLVSNASERIHGVDLNDDGSLGSARGDLGAYFFSNDLRLQGSFTDVQGGAGARLHPDHPSYGQGVSPSLSTLAFVGTGTGSIRIVDTVHFTERGEIAIRDNVVGPLRAGPPLSSDNDGMGAACSGPECVVAKLYGVTDGGGVVVVDVLEADIEDIQ